MKEYTLYCVNIKETKKKLQKCGCQDGDLCALMSVYPWPCLSTVLSESLPSTLHMSIQNLIVFISLVICWMYIFNTYLYILYLEFLSMYF